MKRIILFLSLIGLLAACQTTQANAAPPNIQAPQGVTYAGGDGSSYAEAVIVKAANEDDGVSAEYYWLAQRYPGCKRGQQSSIEQKGKMYDLLEITTAKGEKKTVYFDITDFYGKLE
jgi:hypothetical protein